MYTIILGHISTTTPVLTAPPIECPEEVHTSCPSGFLVLIKCELSILFVQDVVSRPNKTSHFEFSAAYVTCWVYRVSGNRR